MVSKNYDKDRALMLETSILTTGKEDFYGVEFAKIGRRHVWRFNHRNNNGVLVGAWAYFSDIKRALKTGELSVYAK